MSKILFKLAKNGTAYPDHEIYDAILLYYNNKKNFIFSNELVLFAARAMISENIIDGNKIDFYYENQYLGKINKDLQFENPHTYSYIDHYLDIIIKNKIKDLF